jgi:hypothetical protein
MQIYKIHFQAIQQILVEQREALTRLAEHAVGDTKRNIEKERQKMKVSQMLSKLRT